MEQARFEAAIKRLKEEFGGLPASEIGPLKIKDLQLRFARYGIIFFPSISPFITLLSGGDFKDETDFERNGVVNFSLISPFIAMLSAPW